MSELGTKLRQIRQAQGKSLAVVAGLAGITPGYLSRIELGERTLDKRSTINALADALSVAPSELADDMVTEVGVLKQDAYLPAVRQALMAVTLGVPAGSVVDAKTLAERIDTARTLQHQCRHDEVGEVLATLIRDVHTTLNAGRDERELLRLVTLLHLHATQAWLPVAGGSSDLSWVAVSLGRDAAQRLDEPLSLALSGFGVAHELIAAGSYNLAGDTLDAADPGTASREGIVVTGMLHLTKSLLAAAKNDQAGRVPALDHADELAHRIQGAEPWFGFGPSNVGLWRMSVALEAGEYAEVEQIASGVNPGALPTPFRTAAYWITRGRAVAKLPRQRKKAIPMLLAAEKISPARLHRHPLARGALAELLVRAKEDAYGRELRGMAYRAGLRL